MNRLIPIGYFPKRAIVPKGWSACEPVSEICSVSNCIASGPEGWIKQGLHNGFGYFNSEGDAVAACGDGAPSFRMFAFRMLPLMFKDGEPAAFDVPDFRISAIPGHYVHLGFDVSNANPEIEAIPFFGCSPLSCNEMAKEIRTNRFCLLDPLASAMDLAARVSAGGAEPGPYFVVEVLRSGRPGLPINPDQA